MNALTVSGFLLGFTCLFLSTLTFLYGKNKLHLTLAFQNLGISIWGFGCGFASISTTPLEASFYWKVALAGGFFIATLVIHHITLLYSFNHKTLLRLGYLWAIAYPILWIFHLVELKVEYIFDSFYFPTNPTPFYSLYYTVWLFTAIYASFLLVKGYIKYRGEEKLIIGIYSVAYILGLWGGGTYVLLALFNIRAFYPYGNFLIPIYCVLVTYSILKHRLLNIEIIIKKTIVYSIVISVITIFYFIIMFALERLCSGIFGYKSIAFAMLMVILFSFIFIPLKNKIQYAADKYFFKGSISQIEEEKNLLKSELERSERLKTVSSLAAGMAHEIKNPLTSIKTFVEYENKKYNDPEFRKKFHSIVPKEIDKISNIISQLLDYSKTDRTTLRNVDINKVLDYVLDLYNNEFIKKRIEIKKFYDTNKSIKTCDENQIKQAFINIVLNSIEAMPGGGELTVETQNAKDQIEILIKDTGEGIPRDKLKKLFDPFYTTKEKGTGLGLFIVHQIIENNKGRISIESKPNKGTIVKIKISTS